MTPAGEQPKRSRPPIRPADQLEADRLADEIFRLRSGHGTFIGIEDDDCVEVLIAQIIESQRRNRFFDYLLTAELGERSRCPESRSFDPLRSAVMFNREGLADEAFWMVFLYTHFGKNRSSGYGYAGDIYGRLGEQDRRWNWTNVVEDVAGFRQWLFEHQEEIRSRHKPGGFGNHRKYESLDGWSQGGTGAAVESYVDWVGEHGHSLRFETVLNGLPESEHFDSLFDSLDAVHRFGRMAKFDYLMTATKLRLIDAVPTHAHLTGATGPVRGIKLLVTGLTDGNLSPREQRRIIAELNCELGVGFDVLEDALCNWQKSPGAFKSFRG